MTGNDLQRLTRDVAVHEGKHKECTTSTEFDMIRLWWLVLRLSWNGKSRVGRQSSSVVNLILVGSLMNLGALVGYEMYSLKINGLKQQNQSWNVGQCVWNSIGPIFSDQEKANPVGAGFSNNWISIEFLMECCTETITARRGHT